MFYIKHGSDNFTIIDCFLSEENKKTITDELKEIQKTKNITRFISTHPDDDHIGGLEYLFKTLSIPNFYCVQNETTKKDETVDFNKYCELRGSDKAFHITKGCSRKWMNKSCDERTSSGISVLWPDVNNEHFIEALSKAKKGESPNNISPIIKYSLEDGVKVLWMGDLETDFMNKIKDEIDVPAVDILFAPHHGRDTGKVPSEMLKKMNPKIIIIGEALSCHLNYYAGYNTITQNSAKNIILECTTGKVHIYVSNEKYSVDFLDDEGMSTYNNYIGTLNL